MTAARQLPDYVAYPGQPTLPAPVMFKKVTLWGFWLDADFDKLKAVSDQILARPTGGRLRFEPLLSHVLMSFAEIDEGRFVGYEQRGFSSERELTFWIPGALFSRQGDRERFEGLYFFTPYLFLDNPVAMIVGREEFGYFKQPGRLGLPGDVDLGDQFTVDVFGCRKTGPDVNWHYQRFVTLSSQSGTGQPETVFERIEDAVDGAAKALGDWRSILPSHVEVDPEMIAHVRLGRFPQIFLKQFRDIADGTKACYQAVTEANIVIRRFRGVSLAHSYRVRFEPLASTPVVGTLGLASDGSTGFGFKVEMDMELMPGRELWRAGGESA